MAIYMYILNKASWFASGLYATDGKAVCMLGPGEKNGLNKPSQVMVGKVQTIPREKIGEVIGRLAEEEMLAVSRALAVFLGVV